MITFKKTKPLGKQPEASGKKRHNNCNKPQIETKHRFICSMCGHTNPLACADEKFKPLVWCPHCLSANLFEHSRDVRKAYGLIDDVSHTCQDCHSNSTIDDVLSLSEMLILTRQEEQKRFSELEERIEKLEAQNG